MRVQVKKISENAISPRFAQKGDVGADLFSSRDIILKPGERVSCPTGICMKIPEGYVALIWDKGGPSHKHGIKTLGGVFDSNYIGEYLIGLVNLGSENYEIKTGQKIAQVLFQKIEIPEIEIVKELPDTNRGENRFGSTGIFKK